MKSTTFCLSAAALASVALAQPHRHQNHARLHKAHVRNAAEKPPIAVVGKRDLVTDWVIEWVTETVTEYYDVTATSTIVTATQDPATTTTTTPDAAPKSSSDVAAQFFEPSSKPAPAPVAKPSPPPPPPVQDPKPAPKPTQAPPPPPPPPAEPKPTPVPTTLAPVVVPSVAAAPPVVSAPAPPPVQKPAPVVSKPEPTPASPPATGGGGGSGGGTTYTGEVTHYAVGLGACGYDDSGKGMTDYIVALSHDLMTSGGWPDAQCGKKVTFSYKGKSITATVRDKCPSCDANQIDVSDKTFIDLIGDLGIGRAHGVTWTLH